MGEIEVEDGQDSILKRRKLQMEVREGQLSSRYAVSFYDDLYKVMFSRF